MTLQFEPWGEDPVFDWDEGNQDEISNHRVRDFEVEECFRNAHIALPHAKSGSDARYSDRYKVRGTANSGRRLVVIVQYLGADWIRPITAWDDK